MAQWFEARVAKGWFEGPLDVRIDREEILVIGVLAEPAAPPDRDAGSSAQRIDGFRTGTRADRTAIAAEAEALWDRKVSWGVRCGRHEVRFTSTAVPVMTRLRFEERAVLDTLIAGGVARSRSEALAWCVRLVGEHEEDWIARLVEALEAVIQAREGGPHPS
ncbi:MAG: hypothetical protein JWM05_1429 [Acidimicrobiales bacterium]|nr:hypothetical protein [Acidimicrobiales bacterium]